jgi:hypothetical protein
VKIRLTGVGGGKLKKRFSGGNFGEWWFLLVLGGFMRLFFCCFKKKNLNKIKRRR